MKRSGTPTTNKNLPNISHNLDSKPQHTIKKQHTGTPTASALLPKEALVKAEDLIAQKVVIEQKAREKKVTPTAEFLLKKALARGVLEARIDIQTKKASERNYLLFTLLNNFDLLSKLKSTKKYTTLVERLEAHLKQHGFQERKNSTLEEAQTIASADAEILTEIQTAEKTKAQIKAKNRASLIPHSLFQPPRPKPSKAPTLSAATTLGLCAAAAIGIALGVTTFGFGMIVLALVVATVGVTYECSRDSQDAKDEGLAIPRP